MGLTCYCENYCPEIDRFNGTCEGDETSYCFSAIELIFDPELNAHKEYRTFGCLSPDESGLMQVSLFWYTLRKFLPRQLTKILYEF